MRILAGYLGLGLQGIKPIGNFPECYGVFGVHEGAENVPGECVDRKERFSALDFSRSASRGLRIFRPLLGVSKESLVATCKHFNVPWVEDRTNRDPSLTLRNAVRVMLNGDKLPGSLKSGRLVELALFKRTRQTLATKHAESLLHKLHMCKLDARSGRLLFEFREEDLFPGNLGQDVGNRQIRLPTEAVVAAGRIAALVSPLESVPTSTSQLVAEKLFWAILPSPANDHEMHRVKPPVTPFTAAGLLWSPTRKRGKGQSHAYSWDVIRQPLTRNQNMPTCEWSNLKHHEKDIPVGDYAIISKSWQLLDGRFWLRVWSSHYETVQARLLQEDDMSSVLSVFDHSQKKRIKHLLKRTAPGKARWSLPVLVERGSGELLAIPTLGIQLPGTENYLGWQVKYKARQ